MENKIVELTHELELAGKRLAKRQDEITKAVGGLLEKQKQDQDNIKKIKDSLLEQFELARQGGLVDKNWENEYLKVTYVEESKRTGVDAKKLRNNYPDIYDECKKETTVKPHIRLKAKQDALRLE